MTLTCPRCEEPIVWGDELERYASNWHGVVRVQHLECSMRSIVGGINHLKGLCTCCGGDLPPDPPELTKRQAARTAYDYFCEHPP